MNDFKNQSPWGTPPGGNGNGDGDFGLDYTGEGEHGVQ